MRRREKLKDPLSAFSCLQKYWIDRRKTSEKTTWQIMSTDGVVLCAIEKDMLYVEPEQWREAAEKRGMKVLRRKTNHMCYN